MKRFILILTAFFILTSAENAKPKVLIIGDSISIGYTPFVKEALKNDAIVIHNKGNAQYTGTGLKRLDEWLGDEKWDVIQFNWGLWDLCYRHPESTVQGNRDKVNGELTTTLENYSKNLEELVGRLQKTNAKLIFVTTTYVPENEAGRFSGDEDKYNSIALDVMKKYKVKVNSLNNASRKIHLKHGLGNDNVHYTPEGYELLAEKITKGLNQVLKTL